MGSHFNRRDFLKLASLLPAGMAFSSLNKAFPSTGYSSSYQQGKQNVLIIVFDAWAAPNVSLFGYPRETMPNLARLAERAVVYHNHYAGGNFTTPGTATLLTGADAWTHRAFRFSGKVSEEFAGRSIFHAFEEYYRIGLSHNPLVHVLFQQFYTGLDEIVPLDRLLLTNDGFIQALFSRDEDTATVSWARAIKRQEEGHAYSLFLSHVYEYFRARQIENLLPAFPGGLPNIKQDNYYLLEEAIDFAGSKLIDPPRPFLGYFHFMPPHHPYKPQGDFFGSFRNDGWLPPDKPQDIFWDEKSPEFLLARRAEYDEFILNVDYEFGRLFDHLERSGLLDNTWVVLTSDHGEIFERGIWSHTKPVMYQPIIQVPLLIFEPGRKTRMDVYAPTASIDILPTMLRVTGQEIPDWVEGRVLPPFAGVGWDPERSVYALQAMDNEQFDPLTQATVMQVKDRYKLVYTFGYEQQGLGEERIQLFDRLNDPEELNDLSLTKRETRLELLAELQAKLAQVNAPYR